MQETVSGYKFRIFHHCPGGRAWGRLAVVELAAGGVQLPSPWSTVPGRQGPISTQKYGLCPREPEPWFWDGCRQPCPEASAGGPQDPCGFRPVAQRRQRRFCKKVQIHVQGVLAGNMLALHYNFSNA